MFSAINFKGTGIVDLKRTQIYTHTFAHFDNIYQIISNIL
jgi:hypothetical protein